MNEVTQIIWQTMTDSTQDDARALIESGEHGEGLWVGADQQRKGRGRRGRHWQSPPGNLYASWFGRLDCAASEAACLSFVAALAVRQTVLEWLPDAALRFKWPNDVLLGGRKFCGILLELVQRREELWLIVGIGVNLREAPKDTPFPATSLNLDIAPRIFLEKLAVSFDALKSVWLREGFAPIRAFWLEHADGLGEMIEVRLPQETCDGYFEDVSAEGALVLRMDKEKRWIEAGDVFFPSR